MFDHESGRCFECDGHYKHDETCVFRFPPFTGAAEAGRQQAITVWRGSDPAHTDSTARWAAPYAQTDHDKGYVVGMFQTAMSNPKGTR